ncbi:hypothetical protein LX32DRAFT_278779 [Colletotrichum zoysiae]|uniref:Uncharacterized protein n=1 Tax=Colletotrichum zoysiae TaxID=1216348 RepID=A0AAD9LWM9_9PEZI|nr:hypothetical protein LX32DRAFT_278779 [Colletotrichum zoysiae]
MHLPHTTLPKPHSTFLTRLSLGNLLNNQSYHANCNLTHLSPFCMHAASLFHNIPVGRSNLVRLTLSTAKPDRSDPCLGNDILEPPSVSRAKCIGTSMVSVQRGPNQD